MTDFDIEKHNDEIIRKATLTKAQLWKEMSKEPAYQYLNEKSPLSYHFISSIYGNGSVKSKRETFFSKKEELEINWTVTMFTERERKFRNLINDSPLIHSSLVGDFISSVLSQKTVTKRVKHFFSDDSYRSILGEKEFLYLEKKHREYILENKDDPIDQLSRKLNALDKRPVVLKIKKIELDESFERVKDWAKSIPLERKVRKEREMLASGKAKIIINSRGEEMVLENDPWYAKFILAAIVIAVGYFIAPYASKWGSNPDLDTYCKKYYVNYPLSNRDDCEKSYKELQNWELDRR